MPREQPTLGIYVSAPFCAQKCSFCNFASGVFPRERMATYVDHVVQEIRNARMTACGIGAELPATVDSVYFGGGTPSLLPPELFRDIDAALRSAFEFAPNVEWTVECAPGQLAQETLKAMAQCGVNRISFGVQSFVDKETLATGRRHTRLQVEQDIEAVRRAGINNISVDLLAGLPYQTCESWRESLEVLAGLEVQHASVYMLEVDEDSRLGRELQLKSEKYHSAAVPSDDTIADCYEMACEFLDLIATPQYEISNFARDGYESRHNLKYWQRQPYLGFGLDAHSFVRVGQPAVRFANPGSMEGYMRGETEDVQVLSRQAELEEAWFLGLRCNAGVNAGELRDQFGAPAHTLEEVADELVRDGMLTSSNGKYRLSPRGRLVSNDVFEAFLAVTA